MKTKLYISDELLAAFIDGTTTPEQTHRILQVFSETPGLYDEFRIAYLGANTIDDAIQGQHEDIVATQFTDNPVGGMFTPYNPQIHFNEENHPDMVVASKNGQFNDRFNEATNSIYENANQNIMETRNYANVIGDNPQDIVSGQVQQQYSDTCAIKSQQLVLNDFGINVSEDQLVSQAESLNIYHPGQGGTSPNDVGKLLELNGVSCTQHENASIYDLTSALAKGEKVIIGVDSSELWNGGVSTQINDVIHGEQADHALIVAGIDTTDPDNVQVILTDPGTGQEGVRYPMAQFLDAWHDSGNFMVTTDAPAPLAYNPEMVNFDYSQGHLSHIGQMPYEYFDQTVLPVAHGIDSYPQSADLLHHDFSSLLHGDSFSLSHDLFDSIDQIPGDHVHDLSFGSQHMADYFNDKAIHHEHLAQNDIDHGNIDSAQNHLRYADDFHNHAMGEMDDDN